jgi:chemosensory pili system protein ChpA (sensor histidine kinase/response regulator)/putative two-component system response regulator
MDKKFKVLIIDDDKFLLDMYSLKFQQNGFDVEVGIGGEDALTKLRDGLKPDIIMLDIVMPGVDGFEFLKILKKEKLGGNPVVVILSNQGQDEEIKKAKELGADDYIVKASAIPSEVLEQIKKVLPGEGTDPNPKDS